jgi:hypothetical protein
MLMPSLVSMKRGVMRIKQTAVAEPSPSITRDERGKAGRFRGFSAANDHVAEPMMAAVATVVRTKHPTFREITPCRGMRQWHLGSVPNLHTDIAEPAQTLHDSV